MTVLEDDRTDLFDDKTITVGSARLDDKVLYSNDYPITEKDQKLELIDSPAFRGLPGGPQQAASATLPFGQ